MGMMIRAFKKEDGTTLNEVARAAFAEYACHFENWASYHEEWSRMSKLEAVGQILVAEDRGKIIGGVCYIAPGNPIAPGMPRPQWFEKEWAIIRSLVVHPRHRGYGTGRSLTEECLSLAERDNCPTVALQSTPIMKNAVAMYQHMGFRQTKTIGTKDAVTWHLYCLDLHNQPIPRSTPFKDITVCDH